MAPEQIEPVVYLQKALRHDSLWNLRETLLEVLQDVIVELRSSLRHPEPTRRVNEPKAACVQITRLLSFPLDRKQEDGMDLSDGFWL